MRGGTHRALFEVDIAGRGPIVVRGYGDDADGARYEAQVLRWLEAAGIGAPRVLAQDHTALAITRLRGEPVYMARTVEQWVGGLARTLAALHRVELGGAEFLRDHRRS